MEPNKRIELIKKFFEEECLPLLDTKGHDYTQGSNDANSNFKTGAKRLHKRGIDEIDVWAIYFGKHMDAIETWLNDRAVKSEPIKSRIADAVNYLLILHTLIVERENMSRGMADPLA